MIYIECDVYMRANDIQAQQARVRAPRIRACPSCLADQGRLRGLVIEPATTSHLVACGACRKASCVSCLRSADACGERYCDQPQPAARQRTGAARAGLL